MDDWLVGKERNKQGAMKYRARFGESALWGNESFGGLLDESRLPGLETRPGVWTAKYGVFKSIKVEDRALSGRRIAGRDFFSFFFSGYFGPLSLAVVFNKALVLYHVQQVAEWAVCAMVVLAWR